MLAPKRFWQTIGEVLENHEKKHRINSDFPKKHGVKKNDMFNCKPPKLYRSTWGSYKLVTIKLRLVKFQRDFCMHKLLYLKL